MKIKCGFLCLIIPSILFADTLIHTFTSADSGRLYLGDKEIRFVSFTVPNLHYIDNHYRYGAELPWRFPDNFEILDALNSVKQMGVDVIRLNPLTVRTIHDPNEKPVHVESPGIFNETAFQTLDKVLYYANKMGIRLIIPLAGNDSGWGGIAEYASFREKSVDAFWSDQQIIHDFQQTIRYLLNRRNIYTGKKYNKDKAILAWELCSDIKAPDEWIRLMSGFIKKMDPYHLLASGSFDFDIESAVFSEPNIDIFTVNMDCDSILKKTAIVKSIMDSTDFAKPWYLIYHGNSCNTNFMKLMDQSIAMNASGALISNLNIHSRDGGFYRYCRSDSIFSGSFCWTGNLSNENQDEFSIPGIIINYNCQINDIIEQNIHSPGIPQMLPVTNVSAINWQGSAGAEYYILERANGLTGRWQSIAQIADTSNYFDSLYHDTTVKVGKRYYYRVIAANQTGRSAPSAPVLSKKVDFYTFIDHFNTNDKVLLNDGPFNLLSNQCDTEIPDEHCLRADTGTVLEYHLPGQMKSINLLTCFPDSVFDPNFWVSQNGKQYIPLQLKRSNYSFPGFSNKQPSAQLYEADRFPVYSRFLKIQCNGITDFSRVEVEYGN